MCIKPTISIRICVLNPLLNPLLYPYTPIPLYIPYTVMASQLDGLDYLFFAASDGVYNKNTHALEGIGGAQLWTSDGTTQGTVRAFYTLYTI
jgi:hypothetical protein